MVHNPPGRLVLLRINVDKPARLTIVSDCTYLYLFVKSDIKKQIVRQWHCLSRFPFLFHLLSCSGWCTIFVLRRQILASLEEELCGVSPLSSSPCPSSFSGSTATRSSLSTSWSISPIIITESSGGSDGVFSRSNLLQWIEGPSSPARFFFISGNILWLVVKQSYSMSPFALRWHVSLALFLISEETFAIYCQNILDI